jgi:hypothetical protein
MGWIDVDPGRVQWRDKINTTNKFSDYVKGGKFLAHNVSVPPVHFSVIDKIVLFFFHQNSVILRTAIV